MLLALPESEAYKQRETKACNVHAHILCTYAYNLQDKFRMSKIDWQAVGKRVRQLRGFETNQAEFAQELGISQGQLSRYEKGKSEIGAEVLLRISQRFGKSIEWVLTGK